MKKSTFVSELHVWVKCFSFIYFVCYSCFIPWTWASVSKIKQENILRKEASNVLFLWRSSQMTLYVIQSHVSSDFFSSAFGKINTVESTLKQNRVNSTSFSKNFFWLVCVHLFRSPYASFWNRHLEKWTSPKEDWAENMYINVFSMHTWIASFHANFVEARSFVPLVTISRNERIKRNIWKCVIVHGVYSIVQIQAIESKSTHSHKEL